MEQLLTAPGALAAAAAIAGLVQILKRLFPVLDDRLSGAAIALVVSAVLYLWVAAVIQPVTTDEVVAVVLSWLACAFAAVGIASVISHAAVLAGVAALRDPGTAQRAIETAADSLSHWPNVAVELSEDDEPSG